jgi:NADH pyrophosphatase NudC (nudix superfamily)
MLQYTNFTYCPKCGSQELICNESNGMKCSKCSFLYFHNTASAAGAIIESPSGILLVKRGHEPKKGMLDIPGGFVNYNESIEDALIREIHEELAIALPSMTYLGSFPNVYKYDNVTYFTTDAIFICRFDHVPILNPNNEIADFQWYSRDAIPVDQCAFDSTRAAFAKYCGR